MDDNDFIPQQGFYSNLRVYQLAEIIYDVTFFFVKRYIIGEDGRKVIIRGDRTGDQMVQAARSGKQNIAEGSCAGVTSKETEIKFTNVAKSSSQSSPSSPS